MDEILINDVRSIQYSFNGTDWTWTEGQRISSLGLEIDRIYLDQPYLSNTAIERYIIEVASVKTSNVSVWKIIEKKSDGSVFVVELKI